MKCKKCGNEISEKDKFCLECGAEIKLNFLQKHWQKNKNLILWSLFITFWIAFPIYWALKSLGYVLFISCIYFVIIYIVLSILSWVKSRLKGHKALLITIFTVAICGILYSAGNSFIEKSLSKWNFDSLYEIAAILILWTPVYMLVKDVMFGIESSEDQEKRMDKLLKRINMLEASITKILENQQKSDQSAQNAQTPGQQPSLVNLEKNDTGSLANGQK